MDDQLRLDARIANGRVWLERISPHAFEEVICDHLWRYGPVVALGQPGERLAPLGAVRNYLKPDEWRDSVLNLMDRAAIIVLVLRRTENLRLELGSLISLKLLLRTVLVVPPLKPDEVDRRWATLCSVVSALPTVPLPDKIDPRHTLGVVFPEHEPPCLLRSDERDDWACESVIDAAVAEARRVSTQT